MTNQEWFKLVYGKKIYWNRWCEKDKDPEYVIPMRLEDDGKRFYGTTGCYDRESRIVSWWICNGFEIDATQGNGAWVYYIKDTLLGIMYHDTDRNR
jgi:hypothetical protein